MLNHIFILAIAIAALSEIYAQDSVVLSNEINSASQSIVVPIKDDMYNGLFNEKLVMLMFHAHWSVPSVEYLKVYESFANNLMDLNMLIGSVDCATEQNIYQLEKVQNFPSIKLYVAGEAISLNINITNTDEVDYFIRRLTKSALHFVDETPDGFFGFAAEHLTPQQSVAVLIQNPNPDSNIRNLQEDLIFNYDYACKKLFILPCAITSNTSLFATQIQSYPAIVMLRSFPNEPNVIINTESVGSIYEVLSWLQLQSFPVMQEFTEENEPTIYNLRRLGFSTHVIAIVNTIPVVHHVGRDITDRDGSNAVDAVDISSPSQDLLQKNWELAHTYKGTAVFSYVDLASATPYTYNLLDRLDVNPLTDIPMVLIASAVESHVNFYAYKSNAGMSSVTDHTIVTPELMENFLQRYFKDELYPTSRRKHDLPDDLGQESTVSDVDNTDDVQSSGNEGEEDGESDTDSLDNAERSAEEDELYQNKLLQHLMSL